ncbi:MAG: pilus assembly protein [Thiomicrorhabdus sp.]|nr:pilus assembly protein [Thiomicrorhabdus sp.]
MIKYKKKYADRLVNKKRQQGATLVEPIFVLPLFLFMMFGVIEYTYMYRVKATLNLASTEAVRMGALSNALLKPMNGALVASMASEYVKGNDTVVGLAGANVRAVAIMTAIEVSGGSVVSIVSPNKSIFDKHEVSLRIRLVGDSQEGLYKVIPNDNLYWRDPVAKSVIVNGVNQEIGIQDANLLKIKTFWCHRLVTPGLDRIVFRTILLPPAMLGGSSEQQTCNVLSAASNVIGAVIPRGVYLALTSQAIMRMQTPVYYDGNNLK